MIITDNWFINWLIKISQLLIFCLGNYTNNNIPVDVLVSRISGTPTHTMLPMSWWRHQMETFSMLLVLCTGNSHVTGEFAAQRPVTRSFDVFFDLHLNKRLSKQSWGWWFETPPCPLWRHCNVTQVNPCMYCTQQSCSHHTCTLLVSYHEDWVIDTRSLKICIGSAYTVRCFWHYSDVIMGAMASQTTSPIIV